MVKKSQNQNSKSEFTSVLNLKLGFFRWGFLSERKPHRGDTLIEVMFAVAVFGLAAVGTIALMNRGLASVQTSIETTMARQEIDAQAEALRFIHDAYLTEPATKITDATGNEISTNNYRNLWKAIVAQAYPASTVDASGAYSGGVVSEDPNFFTRVVENKATCDSLFTTATSNGAFAVPSRSFVLNPRGLNKLTEVDPTTDQTKILSSYDIRRYILATATDAPNPFTTAATYPRLLYGDTTDADNLSDIYIDNNVLKTKNFGSTLSSAEGIWVTAITSKSGLQCYDAEGNAENNIRPDFYDFHIQTCWDSISGDATVISSTVRLFNPDQVNLKKASMITFDNVEWKQYDNNNNHQGPCSGYDPPEHVIANGTDIEFVGYTQDNMDEGVRYSLSDMTNFTLNVDVDTNGILTHPGGEGLTITIGPIKANIKDNGGSITSGSETQTIDTKTFHLSMTRTGDSYEACANEACVSTTSSTADPTVDFNFKHYGHCCSSISRAKLSNIEMAGITGQELASDSCIPTTVITDPEPNPIPTPNPDPTPSPDEPDPSPTPDPEPEPTEQVEATIVATETNPLQNFDIKFTKSDSTRMGIRGMKIPFVSQVASGISVDGRTCGSAGSGLLGSLLHCGFPYASSYTNFQFQYADGQFIIYLDRDSFTDDTSTTYFGTGSTISDFWSRSGLTVTVYFYDQIYHYNVTEGHESDYAAYSISSDNTNVVDSNGRYWILARVYGNAGTRNYWADKMEIINQRTNTAPSAYLK